MRAFSFLWHDDVNLRVVHDGDNENDDADDDAEYADDDRPPHLIHADIADSRHDHLSAFHFIISLIKSLFLEV